MPQATPRTSQLAVFFRRPIFAVVSLIFSSCLFNVEIVLAAPKLALWVEVEGVNRPFDDSAGFEQFKKFTEDKGFTDLYCQVYRGGRSWFPSSYADDAPYRASLSRGVDPLKETLELAHSRGQKVHAWVNVLRVAHNKVAPLVQKLGEDAVLIDSQGASILTYSDDGRPPGPAGHYFQLDTPAYWLDPSKPAVRQYLLDTIKELIIRYPELDGIHLDMIRFPFAMRSNRSQNYRGSLWFGYSNEALGRFYEDFLAENNSEAEPAAPNFNQWQQWRRSQITTFVGQLHRLIKQLNPKIELSAAVLAWPDRAHDYALQEWDKWVLLGLVDSIVPMSYTRDVETVKLHTQNAVKQAKSSGAPVIMGLGAWLLLSRPEVAAQQTAVALQNGASGVNLFSYSNLLTKQGDVLVSQVEKEIAKKR